jgi:hypothetical protein
MSKQGLPPPSYDAGRRPSPPAVLIGVAVVAAIGFVLFSWRKKSKKKQEVNQ